MKKSSVVVVNASHPEVNHIARAMSEEGRLHSYFRPYTNKGRLFDRLVDRLAKGSSSNRCIEGVKTSEIHEVALSADVKWLIANTAKRKLAIEQKTLDNLMHQRTIAVAREAARRLGNPDVVVCDIGTALEPFKKASGSQKVLNYPIARHMFAREYLALAALKAPEFASTIDLIAYPDWIEDRFEEEVALADLILVGSSFVAQSFISTGIPEAKLKIVPYGTNLSTFTPKQSYNKDSPEFSMIFVGKVGERKGISYLNSAFKALKQEGISLTIVGDIIGGDETLKKLDSNIRYIPHTHHDILAGLYKSHDVFVFPSLIEGMGLVVLEAMASGLPIITTNNGPGDIVRNGVDGVHIDAMSSSSIINAVRRLRENPQIVERMGRSAVTRAHTFSWESYRSMISQIIS